MYFLYPLICVYAKLNAIKIYLGIKCFVSIFVIHRNIISKKINKKIHSV